MTFMREGRVSEAGQSHSNRAGVDLMIDRSFVRNRAAETSSKQVSKHFNTDFTEKKIKPRIYTEKGHVTRAKSFGYPCNKLNSSG